MTTGELLARLRHLEVKFWVEEDRLRLIAPQGVLTAELRAELAERKAEILAFLHQSRDTTPTAPPLIPVARGGDLPLSYAQQRLWFLNQLDPMSPAYYVPIVVYMTGRLNVATLARSLNDIAERHETLRTTFVARAGQPFQ